MTDPASLSATETLAAYRARKLTPVDHVEAVLARVEKHQPRVNAFTRVDSDGVRRAAQASAARWQKGEPQGPLDGVTVTIKDNADVGGWPSRKGSAVTTDTAIPADAPLAARLREAGAIILGKTTMPEFGWIGASHSPLTGPTRNPWNLALTTGGSSAGAAAACALGMGALHSGTDGAGSIRIPAAFCGIYGIKSTFGQVPQAPPSAFTVLSHSGPLTRTVADSALMLSIISQPDPRDILAWNTPAPDFTKGLGDGVRGLRIAWSPRLGFVDNLDPEVGAITEAAARRFEAAGAIVEAADPDLGDPWPLIRTLWYAGSAAAAATIPRDARSRMDQGFVRVIEAGEKLTVPEFLAAFTGRAETILAMHRFHQRYDLLLCPTMPIPAFEVGKEVPDGLDCGDEPLRWARWSPYTWPFNLTQQPSASVPCGFTKAGLPVGLQITGRLREDALVLRASRAFERLAPFAMPAG